MGITFMTLRRRSAALLQEVADLPASAWRRVSLDVPARKFKNPRVFEQSHRPGRRDTCASSSSSTSATSSRPSC